MVLRIEKLKLVVGAEERILAENISFTVSKGSIVIIQGPSGCGKSRLLRAVSCLDSAESQLLEFGGKSPEEWGYHIWRSKVCYVHQKPPNLPGTPESFFETVKNYKTQRKNLEDITQNKAFLDPELTCKQWALEETAFHRPWNQLSGGEQQRAFLAISLALNPSILLLDEPTSALDPDTSILVEQTIINSGITCIWVSHDPQQIKRLPAKIVDFAEFV